MLANKQHRHPAFVRFDQRLAAFPQATRHPILSNGTRYRSHRIRISRVGRIFYSTWCSDGSFKRPFPNSGDAGTVSAVVEVREVPELEARTATPWSKDPKEGPNPKFAAPENPKFDAPANPQFGAAEAHYTPDQLAELWGVSAETVRLTFRNEPGSSSVATADKREAPVCSDAYPFIGG